MNDQSLARRMNSDVHVLLLDDEPMVVDSLETLLGLETSFSVHGFTDPLAAKESLSTQSYHAIVSDFLMPELDGVAFLAGARELQPLASRILLTGYADKRNAIRSINEVGLYQYVEKPWDNDHLLLVLRNAAERSALLRELDERMRGLEKADRALADLRSRLLKTIL
jgi:DNA-binding NtrC family response regulator